MKRWDAAAGAIHDRLLELLHEMAESKPGGHLVEAELREIVLDLSLKPARVEGREAFSQELVELFDSHLDDAIQRASAFRPGRAYCHRCRTSECDDALPPTSRHVFAGYAQTGKPMWIEFSQLCLDLEHPQTDLLFANRPALLTIRHSPTGLNGMLIPAFTDPSFRLLGQVSAGFFRGPVDGSGGRPVIALSLQVAMAIGRRGERRYGLNVLGRAPNGEGLHTLWDGRMELPWRGATRWAQTVLATFPQQRPRRNELQRRVEGVLGGLTRRLERDRRGRDRRTQHAQKRHLAGDRPTRKAIEDAKRVGQETFLRDRESGAFVVLGDRGRTHFFSAEGRLISSVHYSSSSIARRKKTEQWTPAGPGQLASFREQLPKN